MRRVAALLPLLSPSLRPSFDDRRWGAFGWRQLMGCGRSCKVRLSRQKARDIAGFLLDEKCLQAGAGWRAGQAAVLTEWR
jgi:hypothetical protein